MTKIPENGVFLSLEELLILFPFLKKNESCLSIKERYVLAKIEKILYEQASIADIETCLGEPVEYNEP